jgi:tetratricopeptide (TPR) repeat protein
MLLAVLVFFGAVEGMLRILGYGYDPHFLMRSTVNGRVAWIENPGFLYRFMPKQAARSPRPLLIPDDKAEDTVRIFVLGESAAMGDPEPAFGLSQTLRVLLRQRFSHLDFEVFNLSLTAINSHLILPIAKECLEKKPDFLVVYMGNNEVTGPFGPGTALGGTSPNSLIRKLGLGVKKMRMGQWMDAFYVSNFTGAGSNAWEGLSMFKGHHVAMGDPRLQGVYDHFGEQLGEMVRLASNHGVPVFVSNLPSNIRDSAPFASSLDATLSSDQEKAWELAYREGRDLLRAGLTSEAYTSLQRAEEIGGAHADLQFNLGSAMSLLGQAAEAKTHLTMARELDLLRFRADQGINQKIYATVHGREKEGVYFVDAIKAFERQSKGGIPGNNFFWDHVHLRFSATYILARLYADNIAHVLGVQGRLRNGQQGDVWLDAAACASRLGLTRWGQRRMALTMFSRLNQYPFSKQSNREQMNAAMQEEIGLLKAPADVDALQGLQQMYRDAIAQDADNWMIKDQYAKFLKAYGDHAAAETQWKEILDQMPHHFLARYELGILLSNAPGRIAEGETYLSEAIDQRPFFPALHVELGLCLGRQQKYEPSINAFREALALDPKSMTAHANLAIALHFIGNAEEAIGVLENALTVSTNHLPIHLNLARFLLPSKDWPRIQHHLQEVLRLDPNHAEAKQAISKVASFLE